MCVLAGWGQAARDWSGWAASGDDAWKSPPAWTLPRAGASSAQRLAPWDWVAFPKAALEEWKGLMPPRSTTCLLTGLSGWFRCLRDKRFYLAYRYLLKQGTGLGWADISRRQAWYQWELGALCKSADAKSIFWAVLRNVTFPPSE